MTARTHFYYIKHEYFLDGSAPIFPATLERPNHSLYDLFCFNTKFAEKLRRYDTQLSHLIVPENTAHRVYLAIQLLREQTLVTVQENSFVNELIEEAHKEMPKKVLILSTYFDIYFQGVLLPSLWLKNMLPSIIDTLIYTLDTNFQFEPEFINDALYIRLPAQDNYTYDYCKNNILHYLRALYQTGTIALPDCSPLIRRWDLTKITTNLYCANWQNPFFAADKSAFLLKLVLGCRSITLQVPLIYQEAIQEKLKKKHFFNGEQLTVIVGGFNQACSTVKLVRNICNSI